MKKKMLILGGGISGIYLGYKLKNAGFSIKILEANNIIGGRIFTKKIGETKIELGATWLWRYNEELLNVCRELNISLFEQNMNGDALFEATNDNLPQRFSIPKNQEISYRIVGGTATILEKLAQDFSDDELQLNQKVIKIEDDNTSTKVITKDSEFIADVVISTIPPQLLVNSVEFSSELDSKFIQVANNTHTWMKDSIKFALVYKAPFWKENGLSGVGFSNIGPFTEIYDHSDFENNHFALMGFLNGHLVNETKEFREEKIKEQLNKFFGEDGKNYLSYQEKVWSEDEFVNFKNDHFISPHFNNGHEIYQQKYLNGKLIIAGSETSPSYGGYMEGAIYRGNQIVEQLKNISSK
ncbi:flavin monoamine oxidase family protein [Polaribacter sp. SA4-12]|uniref:flavin monoamine oxidase family protein n=1 Tax=Polaribacter sp. SA4-12 TaxID=1312072 RepID=UPI000B3BE5BA|nr:NAD(P)/FAD-dependent oxidoreductase [Polaribacter sp. SA4-12]ARV15043.1 amine oxidase family, flavin-containing protein [Polaribacter sp. SA4-12]